MIDYLSLKQINALHADEIEEAVRQVIRSGWYILGEPLQRFEHDYAAYINTKHCIGCGNGLDALTLILRAYKEMGVLHDGDEVIVPANTFIASILAITENNLQPILIEPDINTLQIDDKRIEQALTQRTRAIMIVHLYGRCAFTEHIESIWKKSNLLLIEDNAQAAGCRYSTRPLKRTGALGNAAAHSFYPSKNLGAIGDAGAVTTDDDNLADTIRALRNYGSSSKYVFPYKGKNSRMDDIQAAVLTVKLKYLDKENERRRTIARQYMTEIHNPTITIPKAEERDSAWHIFPILCAERDRLQQFLAKNGVETIVHYPIPPHQQKCYRLWNALSLPVTERIHREELSLPLNPILTNEEIRQIITACNEFQ